MRKLIALVVVIALLALTLAPMATAQDLTPVRVQLQWVTQAQFAGYYAAAALGYYEEAGLDLEILPGGPDIGPQQVVSAGGAEFGVNWLPSHLAAAEGGSGNVVISQIFQRSGLRQVTWVDSGIESFEDMAGKIVGVWDFGNQFPIFASLVKAGIDPYNPDDVTIFIQPFDMNAFLNREIDTASAMTYNELAQVFEFVAEDGTFPVYTPEDVNIIDLNEFGTATLEDLVFANAEWLAEEGNEEIAVAFLEATYRGWIYCRDNAQECTDFVLAEGPTLGAGHQVWMMNEVNKLIWPSETAIGLMDETLFQQTVDIAVTYEIISEAPAEGIYRNDLAEMAHANLLAMDPEIDLLGTEYEPADVEITPRGE
ncbi:MAG: ABC transporter substrate-binding protein [Chloroflexota bacterium]|nr:ABC transporter substrate-binding protein [Chloroflexota bacterium]